MYIRKIARPDKGDMVSHAEVFGTIPDKYFPLPDNSRQAIRARIERARPTEEKWHLPARLRQGWSIAWLLREERRRRQ